MNLAYFLNHLSSPNSLKTIQNHTNSYKFIQIETKYSQTPYLMASPIFISHPPPGFRVISILRGFQLAILGSYRAFKNPNLFKNDFYMRVFQVIKFSIIMHIIINIPLVLLTLLLKFLSLILISQETVDSLLSKFSFFQIHLLDLNPFLIMSFKFFTSQLDYIFFESMSFADQIYSSKHPNTRKQYSAPLQSLKLSTSIEATPTPSDRNTFSLYINKLISFIKSKIPNTENLKQPQLTGLTNFLTSFSIQTAISITLYTLSKTPYIGNFAIPITTFQNLNNSIGTFYSCLFFIFSFVIPQEHSFFLLKAIMGTKTLSMSLLAPYFNKLPFSKNQRELWFKSRIGVLFGFTFGFYLLLRVPVVGLLSFGFAEGAMGYLTTKITDPLPTTTDNNSNSINQLDLEHWIESQCFWNNDYYEEIEKVFSTSGGYSIPGGFLTK